jgi:hypothetical protein
MNDDLRVRDRVGGRGGVFIFGTVADEVSDHSSDKERSSGQERDESRSDRGATRCPTTALTRWFGWRPRRSWRSARGLGCAHGVQSGLAEGCPTGLGQTKRTSTSFPRLRRHKQVAATRRSAGPCVGAVTCETGRHAGCTVPDHARACRNIRTPHLRTSLALEGGRAGIRTGRPLTRTNGFQDRGKPLQIGTRAPAGVPVAPIDPADSLLSTATIYPHRNVQVS